MFTKTSVLIGLLLLGGLAAFVLVRRVPATEFYPAEEYHQDYHEKNPVRYKFYRWNCGRDQRLAELWRAAPTHAEAAR